MKQTNAYQLALLFPDATHKPHICRKRPFTWGVIPSTDGEKNRAAFRFAVGRNTQNLLKANERLITTRRNPDATDSTRP